MAETTSTTSVFGDKPLMTPVTTAGSGVGPEHAVTTTVPAISSVAATSTVSSLTYTAPTSIHTRSQPHDTRVGWIYDLSKEQLIERMAQYGLDTMGSSADLRQRFSAFWKKQARPSAATTQRLGEARPPVFLPTTTVGLSLPASTAPVPRILVTSAEDQMATSVALLGNELDFVREILGLSPNTDSRTLRETLASVVRQSRTDTPADETGLPFAGIDASLPPRSGFDHRPEGIMRPTVGHEGPPRPKTLEIPARSEEVRTTVRAAHPNDSPTVCKIVRKWGLKFDGRRDAVSFLERLEELMASYSLSQEDMVKALPELLQGSALLWYRNCKDLLYSFDAFRRQFEIQFLPPGYRRNLDEEIRKRTQGEDEHFRDFVTAIMTLVRRSDTLSEQGKLDLIFKNMRPEYKLMVRRQECSSLADMMERAEDYEAYLRDKASFRPPPAPNVSLVQETAYVHKRKDERKSCAVVVDRRSRTPQDQSKKEKWQVSTADSGQRVGFNSNRPRKEWPVSTDRGSKSSGSNLRCHRCHEVGHLAKNCEKPRAVRCFGCGRPGVTVTQCDCRAGNGTPAQSSGGQLSEGRRDARPPQNGQNGSGR